MLSEEIFTIEVVVGSISAGGGLVIRVAEPSIAAVEAELKMLRRDVAFPFIFGGEAAFTTVVGEGADKRAAVTVLVAGSFSRNILAFEFGRGILSLRGFEDFVAFHWFHEGGSGQGW